MVQGCVICYNDTPELIERCLKSIRKKVEHLLVVDGAFANYPHENPVSTDGTLEVAQRYADRVIKRKDAWRSQMDKRNAYLTLENVRDYYLWLDTDEYLDGEIPKDLKEDFYAVPVVTGGALEYQIRLFRQQKGLKYKKKHSWLWLDGQCVSQDISNSNFIKLDTFRIIHTPDARTQKRQDDDFKYITDRKEPENLKEVIEQQPQPLVGRMQLAELISNDNYNGFDLDSKAVSVTKDVPFRCSESKAQQLLTDFPKQFRRI